MSAKLLNLLLFVLWLALLGWMTVLLLTPPELSNYLPTESQLNQNEIETALLESVDILQMPEMARYSEITERPLFYPERRPPKEPEPIKTPELPPEPEQPPKELTLIGVLVTPQVTTAMVKIEDEPKTGLLKVGDAIDSWQLAEINPSSILLKKDNETREIELVRNKRNPTMTPRSLAKPPPEPAVDPQTGQPLQQEKKIAETPTQETAEQQQASAEERLRLRQERLKAIAERRRQLLERRRNNRRARQEMQQRIDNTGNNN